jgi:inorganic pyrophosphatase
MPNLLKIPTWADEQSIHAVIETPRGSTCKLDFDPKLRVFTLAKPLMAGLTYPYDWGFIPSTQAEDGDPLDVLVIHDAQTYPGVVLRCRPVGILEVEQKSKGKRERGMTVYSRCRTAPSRNRFAGYPPPSVACARRAGAVLPCHERARGQEA